MNEKELKIPFNAPLREEDTESQTYGCRQTIPIFVGTMGLLVSVPLQARMEFAESHHVHGRDSTKSSKIKPLNSRL